MNALVCSLDIETEPESDAVLQQLMPEFAAPGNYKDPIKIEQNIAEQKARWIEKAALDPVSGRVLAAGYQFFRAGVKQEGGLVAAQSQEDERRVIQRAFSLIAGASMGAAYAVLGFDMLRFDLPFLMKRAWKLRVPVPQMRSGRYWLDYLVDVREVWTFGDKTAEGSLDALAKYFGLPPKLGNGAHFARLWHNPETRPQATEYLKRDLELPYLIGQRMGLFEGATEPAPIAPVAPPPSVTGAPSNESTGAASTSAINENF